MKHILLSFLLIASLKLSAQNVGINSTGATPNAAAILDLKTGNPAHNMGFLAPSVSLTDVAVWSPLTGSATIGMIVYDSNTTTIGGNGAGYYYWGSNSQWNIFTTGIIPANASYVKDSAWLLTGNAGTNSVTDFIGTTDANDLVFKTANTEDMRLSATNGFLGIRKSSPTQPLDVAGNIEFSQALMPNGIAGAAGNILLSAGAGAAPTWLSSGTNGQILSVSGGVPTWTIPTVSGSYVKDSAWLLTGNGGTSYTYNSTSPIGNYIGTKSGDDNGVMFAMNGLTAGRIEDGTTANGSNYNTSFGWRALQSNTVISGNNAAASQNAAFGVQALQGNTSGSYNTAMGTNALIGNTTGLDNTAVGWDALNDNTIHSSNVAVGYFCLFNNNANQNVAVGDSALAANTSGTGNSALGYQALSNSTTATQNAAFGYQALKTANTGSNAAFGYQALKSFTGNNCVAVGSQALQNNTTGQNEVAVGAQALIANTAGGNSNTALGAFALTANNGGANNTAVGTAAMITNITGNLSVAVGSQALNNNNASNNTGVGANTLFSNSSGTNNTAYGYQAGYTSVIANANTTGSNNTYIGYNAGPGTSTQYTNSTAIGSYATVSQSNSLILGGISGINGAGANTLVGIGTNAPAATLHVVENGNPAAASDFGTVPIAEQIENPGGTMPVLYIKGSSSNNPPDAALVIRATSTAFYAGTNNYSNFRLSPIPAITAASFTSAKDGNGTNFQGITIAEATGYVGLNLKAASNTPIVALNPLDVSGSAAIGTYATVNTAPANGLIVSGNVGIGTSAPSATLHVIENGNPPSDFGAVQVAEQIENVGGTMPVLYIKGSTSNNPPDAALVVRATSTAFYLGTNNYSNFRISPISAITGTAFGSAKDGNGTNFPGITIAESNGYVGLNLTAPSNTATVALNPLDVSGSVAVGTYAGTIAAPSNSVIVSGQVGVGTSAPNAAAALDVTSTTQGFLPPRMTTAQMNAISTPAAGLIVYNSTNNCLELYTNAWQPIYCVCSGPPAAAATPSGPATFCPATTATYTVAAIPGATYYTWSVPSGATITSGQGTNSIGVTFGSSAGNIGVTATNNCGTSTISTLAVGELLSVPITITNNQSSATPSNFPQMVTVNSSTYSSYESSGLQNVEFTTGAGATGTPLQAWIESGASSTSTSTVYWVNLASNTIAASGGTLTIYMNFMTSNIMNAGGPTGEAPQLSANYAQYDNASSIFGFYDNFNGASLNANWTSFGTAGTATVNNGVTLSGGTGWWGYQNTNTGGYNGSTAVIEAYQEYTGSGGGAGIGQYTGAVVMQGGYVAIPGASIVSMAAGAVGANDGTVATGFASGTYNLVSMINNGANQLMQSNYGTAIIGGANADAANSNIIILSNTGSPTFQYMRARAYPPSGVMPTTSFGSVACP